MSGVQSGVHTHASKLHFIFHLTGDHHRMFSDVSLSILNLLRKMYINLFQVLVNPMDAEGTIPAVVIIGAVLQVCCSVCVCVPCVCVQCVQCVFSVCTVCTNGVCVYRVYSVCTVCARSGKYGSTPNTNVLSLSAHPHLYSSSLLPPSSSKGDRRGGADVTVFL